MSKPSSCPVRHTVNLPRVSLVQQITALSSFKVSGALELLCPEYILEVQYNNRPNVISVGARNEQRTRTLPGCAILVGIPIIVYEPLPRPCVSGAIRDDETEL